MNYKLITKNHIITIKADNVAGGIEMGTRSDFVCFYAYYNDGIHKTPQKREVARVKEDDIVAVISKEYCEVQEVINESNISD